MATAPGNPFRALDAYTRADRDRFFGRDGDLTLVLDRLLSRRTTLLFAASGVGKTSFLHARLAPELDERFFVAIHARWSGGAPLQLVIDSVREAWRKSSWPAATAATPCAPESSPPPTAGESATPDAAAPDDLLALYRSFTGARGCVGAVLILDQFEEVFQQYGDSPMLLALVDAIATVVNAREPDVRVVLSMREEFLGELSVFDNRVPDLFGSYYRLKNPTRRQARTIIQRMARTAGVEASPALDLLVEDLAFAGRTPEPDAPGRERLRDAVPPPFLQVACQGLWNAQFSRADAASPPPTNAGSPAAGPTPPTFPEPYQRGDAVDHLHAYCDRLLSVLSTPAERNVLTSALGFLMTRRGAKVAYEVSSLAKHSGLPEASLRHVLDKLSGAKTRLFRRTEAADGSLWYELYHDMYSTFLQRWRAERHLEQETRARHARWGIFAGALAFLPLAVFHVWSTNQQLRTSEDQVKSLETTQAQERRRQLTTPVEQYLLRFAPHTERILDVVVSTDGTRVASASFDGTAKIWDPERMLALETIRGSGGLHAAAFAPGAPRLLALAGADLKLRFYDIAAHAVSRERSLPKTAYALAYSPSGRMVACGGDGGLLWLVDDSTGIPREYRWPNAVNSVAFTPDGTELVVGDFGGRVALIPSTGALSPQEIERGVLTKHELSVLAVAVSPDGGWVASGGRDMEIRLVERATRRERFGLRGHTAAVRGLAFSPDSKLLASAGVDGTVRLWDIGTASQVATFLGHAGAVYAVAFDPAGSRLYSAGEDRVIRIWDVPNRREHGRLVGEWTEPRRARFSNDLSIVITEQDAPDVHVWSGTTAVRDIDPRSTAAALTADGRFLALGAVDGTVHLSRMGSGKKGQQLAAITGSVRGILFSGNRDVLAVQSADARSVHLFKLAPAKPGGQPSETYEPKPFARHTFDDAPAAAFVALNQAGTLLAQAGARTVRVSRAASPAERGLVLETPADILSLTYDAFGRLLILLDDQTVVVANEVGTMQSVQPVIKGGRSQLAAVSADGRDFAFARDDRRTVLVQRQRSPDPLELTLPDPVIALAFSTDGTRLATLDERGAVRMYALTTGRTGTGGFAW